MGTDYADFLGGMARVLGTTEGTEVFGGCSSRRSRVGCRGSTSLIAATQWLAILRVKALLGFSRKAQPRCARSFQLGLRIQEFLFRRSAFRCGTGILPVFHGRDAHATALRAEFSVRIEDLGVFLLRWAFNVLSSAFRRGTGILPVFHGRDAHALSPLTSYCLLPTAYYFLPLTSHFLPPSPFSLDGLPPRGVSCFR